MSIVGMGVPPHFASPHAPTIAARLTHMDAKFASLVARLDAVTTRLETLGPAAASSEGFLFISAAFVV